MITSRALDHLVIPVTDLTTARARLTRLGFTVADDARHPFGTENACVFLADKTYLEPLAVGSREGVEVAVQAGNQFVARDRAFRFRNGEEGLSAIVMGTSDADADHAAFRASGFSAGAQLSFSRIMKFPDGTEIEPSFKLSFAADLRAPDFFAFTCERVNMPPADRSTLERHANGVTGISRIVLSEADPAAFAGYLQAVTGGTVDAGMAGTLALETANVSIDIVDPATLKAQFGVARSAERGLRGEAVVFAVTDLAATERLLAANGVKHMRSGGMVLVPREPGQGTLLAFSE
jgi:catechol 2,3-dioxygenase-like lactoylglutathione lyase family enzyme